MSTLDTGAQTKGIIKLRLNLATSEESKGNEGGGVKRSPAKRRHGGEKERVTEAIDDENRNGENRPVHDSRPGSVNRPVSDNKLVNDGRLANDKPVKLTVRLKAPEEKRKIVLSVKSRTEEKSESIDIESVDRPAKRLKTTTAPKVKRVHDVEVAGPKQTRTRRTTVASKEKNGATPHPFSTVPSAPKTAPTAAAKMPIPNFRPSNMTRVPIAALSSLTTMTPGEREEERILRQSISETFGTLWPMVTRPDASKTFTSWEDVPEKLVPYWLMLSPIDSALHAPTLKSQTLEVEQSDRSTRLVEEVTKLRSRYEQVTIKERNKEIATELLVLEQRLCLEEEKFLYAKLKSEYNKKVGELVARKRQHAEATNSALHPHQRILPKAWTSGSGIQILRGSSSENP
ncbi:hypothetical protein PSACC_00964 [Paramicrosporidium saccamoebae]|uniref:GLTSCR protein conserved domain-containing protein n=1 Tax=Paramicrosporidium saccamoebae TaxID=1246581 RepID=A0A2H9TN81_9FUNG|nr:hypothetical protein PSACC_00964 [Paramicrosporidium saccamoebae]